MSRLIARFRPGFEWLLAWRIVRSRKSQFLSVITVVAVVGISVGVSALTIVLSVTGGFQDAFRERILGLHPHLLVWPRDSRFSEYRDIAARLESDPRVLGATAATYDEMMMAHGDRRAGAVVKGVDLKTVEKVLNLRELISEGSLDSLDEAPVLSRSVGQIELSNLVHETSWTVVLWGESDVSVLMEEPTAPGPDEASLVVMNAAPNTGDLDVALDASNFARISALKPGDFSRPTIVPAGDVSMTVDTSDGNKHPVFAGDVSLQSGHSYILVVTPDGTGDLLTVSPTRPATGEARLRVVETRPKGSGALTVTAANIVIPPGKDVLIPARAPAILLGAALAERLQANVGETVSLASSFRGLMGGGPAPMGMEPTSGRFVVGGLFKSGYYDYDKRFAIAAFGAATRFLNTGDRAKWLEVKIDNIFRIDERKQVVQDLLQPYSMETFVGDLRRAHERARAVLAGEVSQYEVEDADSLLAVLRNAAQGIGLLRTTSPHTFSRQNNYAIITWHEVNEPLFQALKLQKLVLSIFFLIIIVVAAFNVVGTQIMMVQQKTKEIAILKALGCTRWMVQKVFLIQGLMVATLGTAIGLVVGLGVCGLLELVGYPLEPEVYLISKLPVAINFLEIGLVSTAALILTFLATLFSANRAGRMLPADGLRYIE
ncbi:MAG: ABC-type lipoprotein release transport system permease subunit [Myxococcota bacterium]|jgi:ABC-type lipoprotein release transport system permease subunit